MAARIEKTVFISYRRTNFWTALAVFQNLHQNGYDVFFDYKSIPSGDFEQAITEAIKSRAHFIVILSPSALDHCNEPEDWLRREIELAFEHKRNIIPLTMEGFDFGSPATVKALTGKLANLKKYNAMSIPSEYFDDAMAKLKSEKFLNRPLEFIAHPISEVTMRITEVQKHAASEADPVEKEQLTAQEWLERGYVFASSGAVDEGLRCLTESIRLKSNYEAYYSRGILQRQIGNLEEAIRDYDIAIDMMPEKAQAYNNRGNARRDKGDLDGAMSDYNTAIRLNVRATRAFINRGVIRRIQGDIDGALADFNEALGHKGGDPEEIVEASYNRGSLLQFNGALEDAIKDFEKALHYDSVHIVVRAGLVDVLRKLGRSSEAAEQEYVARQLLILQSEYNLACFESILGNTDEALMLLEIALRSKQATRQWSRVDPDFDNIRDDPRFKALVGE